MGRQRASAGRVIKFDHPDRLNNCGGFHNTYPWVSFALTDETNRITLFSTIVITHKLAPNYSRRLMSEDVS
jgi:hypothetical protein